MSESNDPLTAVYDDEWAKIETGAPTSGAERYTLGGKQVSRDMFVAAQFARIAHTLVDSLGGGEHGGEHGFTIYDALSDIAAKLGNE